MSSVIFCLKYPGPPLAAPHMLLGKAFVPEGGELHFEAYDLAVEFSLEKLGHLARVCHAGAIAVRMAVA